MWSSVMGSKSEAKLVLPKHLYTTTSTTFTKIQIHHEGWQLKSEILQKVPFTQNYFSRGIPKFMGISVANNPQKTNNKKVQKKR